MDHDNWCQSLDFAISAWRLVMEDHTSLRTVDDVLTRQCIILKEWATSCRKINEIEAGIRGTLELILERFIPIEKRSTPVSDLNCEGTRCSVCSVEYYICIRTSL